MAQLSMMINEPLPEAPDSKLALALIENDKREISIAYFSHCKYQLNFKLKTLDAGEFLNDSIHASVLRKLGSNETERAFT